MLLPDDKLIQFYNKTVGASINDEILHYIAKLCSQIISKFDPRKILLVSVLRGGSVLALVLKYFIDKNYGTDIEIAGISPNYLNESSTDFINFINKSNKQIVFIDGWISRGVTYSLIKEFWQNEFHNRNFNYVAVVNLSLINEPNLIYATSEDVFVPWSMFQTDFSGLSNFFLHPERKKSCAFFIPWEKRIIVVTEEIEKLSKQEINKKQLKIRTKMNRKTKKHNPIYTKTDQRKIKFGINECIKAINKGDQITVYIGNMVQKNHAEILKGYAELKNASWKITEENFCYVVKNISQ